MQPKIDLCALRDANGQVLSKEHPIRKLLVKLPWLHGLIPVRMFFQIAMLRFRDRLTAVNESQPLSPAESRRALLFLENVPMEVTEGEHTFKLREVYQLALQEISDVAKRVPALRARSLESFESTVAVLMHAIRLNRPQRAP